MPAIMSCLPSLWSISAPRTSPEAQLETIGCFLELASRSAEFMKTFKALGLLLFSSFQSTLKFVTNKRKLHSLFVTKYIEHWITVLSYRSLAEELSRSLFSFGAGLLFIPEVLRNDPTSGDHLFSSFSKFTESNTSQWMLVLAKLFESFLSALQAHKSNLPGSFQERRTSRTVQFHGKGIFLCLSRATASQTSGSVDFLGSKTDLVADTLEQSLDGELWQAPLECLKLVSQLNFELVASSLPRILALLVSDQTRSHSGRRLKSLTLYTEAVIEGAFLCNLQKGSTLPSRIFLFHSLHLSRMHRGFSSYLSHGQIEPLLGILEASLHRCWFDDSSTIAVEPSPQNKRRRISTNQSKDPNTRAMHTYLVCEISCHVLSALPRVPEDAKDEVQRIIHGFRTNIVLRKIRQLVDDLSSQSSQTVVAGLIRLNYNLTIFLADDLNILLEASQKFGLDDGPPICARSSECAYRMLLMWSSASPPNRLGPTLDSLLHYLDCHHTLDESSTSVLSMLLQRWMHVVDCLSTSYDGYGQNVILASSLYSAAFWELPRTREALSTIMDKEVGEIESTLLTAEFPDIFSFLLYIPGEYLPKQTLASFFKVAMTREGNMTMDNAPRLFTTQATRAFMSRYLSTHEAADIR
ncbi:hypothetical protein DL96DRAFT_1573943 [Flagelloscypha sp. PMI_526]|nr:hypothetical protein DL96DRAFT_1573943 [Flagelloscypha sp. PMI_526]